MSLRDAWIPWLGGVVLLILLWARRHAGRRRIGLWVPSGPNSWRSDSGIEGVFSGLLLATMPLVVARFIDGALSWAVFAVCCALPSVAVGLIVTMKGWRNEIDLERRVLRIQTGVRWAGLLKASDPPREIPFDRLRLRLQLRHELLQRNPSHASTQFHVVLQEADGEPILLGSTACWSLSPGAPWRRVRGEARAWRWLEEAARTFRLPVEDGSAAPVIPGGPTRPEPVSGLEVEPRGAETWIWLGPWRSRRVLVLLAAAATVLPALGAAVAAWEGRVGAAALCGLLAVGASVWLLRRILLRRERPVAIVTPGGGAHFSWVGPAGIPLGGVFCGAPWIELAVKQRLQPGRSEDCPATELAVRGSNGVVRCLPGSPPEQQAWLARELRGAVGPKS